MNVNEAIAAVKSNQPHDESPLPWRAAPAVHLCNVLSANDEAVATQFWYSDAAHIAAAVNAAPVLIAEVERLQAALAEARVAVEESWRMAQEKLDWRDHDWGRKCSDSVSQPCCGSDAHNANLMALRRKLDEARRALGLEVGHG